MLETKKERVYYLPPSISCFSDYTLVNVSPSPAVDAAWWMTFHKTLFFSFLSVIINAGGTDVVTATRGTDDVAAVVSGSSSSSSISGNVVRLVILDGGLPWGFRMQGGIDTGVPLRIARVSCSASSFFRLINQSRWQSGASKKENPIRIGVVVVVATRNRPSKTNKSTRLVQHLSAFQQIRVILSFQKRRRVSVMCHVFSSSSRLSFPRELSERETRHDDLFFSPSFPLVEDCKSNKFLLHHWNVIKRQKGA